MTAPVSPVYVPVHAITCQQWQSATDVRPQMTPSTRPGVHYPAAERTARKDPTGDQAVAEILARGGFIIRETVTVREIVVPGRVTAAEARARAWALGLTERTRVSLRTGGRWLPTPAVLEALAGRTLAEILPGNQGASRSAWPVDERGAA